MEWSASGKGFAAKSLRWKQAGFKNVRGCATGRKKIINWRKRSRELIAILKIKKFKVNHYMHMQKRKKEAYKSHNVQFI